MKLTARDQEQQNALAHAFHDRERFVLTGAGLHAEFVAETLNRVPCVFGSGRFETNLELVQVTEATTRAAWNGEGLPPVGCEFERRFVDHDGSSWSYGKMIAHGKRRVFYVDRTGDEWSHSPEDMEFRQIRTPEQIASEEKASYIEEAQRSLGVGFGAAQGMWFAGYRKQ